VTSFFQRLLAKDIITTHVVDLLLSWKHPRFSVFCGDPAEPDDSAAMERLARYMAEGRMAYDAAAGTVGCQGIKIKGRRMLNPPPSRFIRPWIGLHPHCALASSGSIRIPSPSSHT
jgi:hypothetical protein